MAQPTFINIGPVRPSSGPQSRVNAPAVIQGGGRFDDRISTLEANINALQQQIYALSSLLDRLIPVPVLIGSGANHQAGVVPDPGSTAGTAKVLREDGTFSYPTILRPDANSTTAVQVQNAAGTALVDVDTTNGRVGIGTTNPVYLLDVNGLFRSTSALFKATSGTTSILIQDGVPTTTATISHSNALFKISDNAAPVEFDANTNGGVSNQLYLATTGNVGIGTATPGSKFAVVGLPTYASNALALAGGLTAGDFYTDGAGSPKIVF